MRIVFLAYTSLICESKSHVALASVATRIVDALAVRTQFPVQQTFVNICRQQQSTTKHIPNSRKITFRVLSRCHWQAKVGVEFVNGWAACKAYCAKKKLEKMYSRQRTWQSCDPNLWPFISGSMHLEALPLCLPTLVLVDQAVFLLERGHTDGHKQNHLPLITLLKPWNTTVDKKIKVAIPHAGV